METMIDGTLSYDTNYDAVQKEIMICGRNLINLESTKQAFMKKKIAKEKDLGLIFRRITQPISSKSHTEYQTDHMLKIYRKVITFSTKKLGFQFNNYSSMHGYI